MTARHTVAALGAAMILSAAAAEAADGILIAQKMTSATGTVTTHQIEIEKTRMRAESEAAGRKMKMIFDGTAQVMRTIDDDAKSYTEMSKADMEKMSAQMSGAMAQMQEQMKNMPPEARKRMEAAMQGRGVPGGAAAAPTEYKKVGTDKVGKWTCDKYEGTRGGEKVSELCTVRAGDARLHAGRLRGHQADGGVLLEAGAAGRRSDVPDRIASRQRLLRAAGPHRDLPQRRAQLHVGDHRRQPAELSRLDLRGAGGLHQARHDGRSRTRTAVIRKKPRSPVVS